MAMVEVPLILDAIVTVSIAAGAFFAVIELRDMKKDRQTQLVLDMHKRFSDSDFEGHAAKVLHTEFKDGEEAEQRCSVVTLGAVGDYFNGIGVLIERDLVDRSLVFDMVPFDIYWDKLRPWALLRREELQNPTIWDHFEYAAKEQNRHRASG